MDRYLYQCRHATVRIAGSQTSTTTRVLSLTGKQRVLLWGHFSDISSTSTIRSTATSTHCHQVCVCLSKLLYLHLNVVQTCNWVLFNPSYVEFVVLWTAKNLAKTFRSPICMCRIRTSKWQPCNIKCVTLQSSQTCFNLGHCTLESLFRSLQFLSISLAKMLPPNRRAQNVQLGQLYASNQLLLHPPLPRLSGSIDGNQCISTIFF